MAWKQQTRGRAAAFALVHANRDVADALAELLRGTAEALVGEGESGTARATVETALDTMTEAVDTALQQLTSSDPALGDLADKEMGFYRETRQRFRVLAADLRAASGEEAVTEALIETLKAADDSFTTLLDQREALVEAVAERFFPTAQ